MTDDIPEGLRRDRSNRAPFMHAITYVTGRVPNIPPWRALSMTDEEIKAYGEQHLTVETPHKNNRAPFMEPPLCDDEGCPQFGTPHVCINRAERTQPCTLCAAVESPGFYTGCMVRDGHAPEWNCDGQGNLTPKISPADSPPASLPNWVPPWASKC